MKKAYITPMVEGEEYLMQSALLDGSYTSQYSDDKDEGADDGFTRRKTIWGENTNKSGLAQTKLWE